MPRARGRPSMLIMACNNRTVSIINNYAKPKDFLNLPTHSLNKELRCVYSCKQSMQFTCRLAPKSGVALQHSVHVLNKVYLLIQLGP